MNVKQMILSFNEPFTTLDLFICGRQNGFSDNMLLKGIDELIDDGLVTYYFVNNNDAIFKTIFM